ncbi:hypothetical protein GN956_G9857 [Arapaima gigas]
MCSHVQSLLQYSRLPTSAVGEELAALEASHGSQLRDRSSKSIARSQRHRGQRVQKVALVSLGCSSYERVFLYRSASYRKLTSGSASSVMMYSGYTVTHKRSIKELSELVSNPLLYNGL